MNDLSSMKLWKKIAIRALFGGIGFAIGAAAIICAAVWYSDRPKPTPPWDATALRATFDTMEYIGASKLSPNTYALVFEYNVKNTTNRTYEVNTSALTPMAVLTEGKALSKMFSDYQSGDVTIDAPEFIPPGNTGRMTVRVSYFYPQEFSDADKDNFEKVVGGPLDKQLRDLGSIVLFDGLNHYQIDLPSGWANAPGIKEGTKRKDLSPCPANDPAGLFTKTPCTPLPGR